MASQATTQVAAVMGMARLRAPIFIMSTSSPGRACMTLPAPRNSRALKKAWATNRKIAAE